MGVDEMQNYLGMVSSGSDREDDISHMLAVLEGKDASLEYRSYNVQLPQIMVTHARVLAC